MPQIDVLRPVSVRKASVATAVPSGTLSDVTSDDNDATWLSFPVSGSGSNWSMRVEPHSVPAGYGRHRIRGRVRIRVNAGTATEDIDVGRGEEDYIRYGTVNVTSSFTEQSTPWMMDTAFQLAQSGTISDFNIGGGWWYNPSGGAVTGESAEYYLDVDCRMRPDFTPDVEDGAGVSQSGGTITNTRRPVFVFGGVSYDGLPPLQWTLTCGPFSTSGWGSPPTSVTSDVDFDNGSYVATFTVSSTIRGTDPFTTTQEVEFDVNVVVPVPPPPANVTATEQNGGILLTWENPGGQPWDDNYVVAEILRSDCDSEERRIAVIEDGLTGSYFDAAVPTRNASPGCTPEECKITYRIRYWGTISEVVELPSTVPKGMIIGWPSTVETIPSGWTRVTALDGRHPRGSAAAVSGATGGSSSHSHTTPGHTHAVGAHSHSVGGSTGTSNASTTSARFNGASQPQADQPHSHSRPGSTGSAGGFTTGSAAPGTSSADNTPPVLTVIWIESDGTPTAFPVGSVAYSVETIDNWASSALSTGRFLLGASTGADGGLQAGSATHTHTINAHTHSGNTHSHSIGSTGLSNPLSSIEAGYGSSTPRWLPRHTHPMTVSSASTGNTSSSSGGTTSSASNEPPHRRVNIIHNIGGGLQTRVIGLFRGDIATAPSTLTRCDGTDGTPDMRNLFARDKGSDSINTIGGSTTHSHTTPTHSHTFSGHVHGTSVGISTTNSFEAPSFGDLGDSPTTTHTHSSGNTGSSAPPVSTASSGTTSTADHTPPYEDVHFVRLDGVSTEPIEIPQITTSEFAVVTVDAPEATSDRISGGTSGTIIDICPNRSYELPRLSARSVQLGGGTPQVSTTTHGRQQQLVIPTRVVDIPALEEVLSERMIWYAPLDGPSGWYAPAGWQVGKAVAGVRELSITLVRVDPPTPTDPEDLL